MLVQPQGIATKSVQNLAQQPAPRLCSSELRFGLQRREGYQLFNLCNSVIAKDFLLDVPQVDYCPYAFVSPSVQDLEVLSGNGRSGIWRCSRSRYYCPERK